MSEVPALLSLTLAKPTLHIPNSMEVQPRDEKNHDEIKGNVRPENSLTNQCQFNSQKATTTSTHIVSPFM